MPHRTAAIISQGDEIVLGQTLDTNSKWIAERLMERGIEPVEHVSLPDDQPALVAAFKRLGGSVDLIICTGGLGPTDDDLTRAALAEAMGEPLVEDDDALTQITEWFKGRGRPMPDLNRVQAFRPATAQSIQNHHGTAPGIAARVGKADVFCIPGPPRELFPMFLNQVGLTLTPPPEVKVQTWTVHTMGLGESDVATKLAGSRMGNLMSRGRPLLVGTTASGGVVSVRIRGVGPDPAPMVAETVAEVRALLGVYAFADGAGAGGHPHEALPTAVLAALRQQSRTLGVVESCTAGLLGSMLGDIPGASDVLLGGLITYSNALKTSLAQVPEAVIAAHGAVSGPCAQAMAEGGLRTLGVSDCVSITGVAGPGGGSEIKPVGTVWIAHASRHLPVTDVRRFSMAGDRRSVREWAARSALAMLWTRLASGHAVPLLRQIAGD